jgi:nicotinamide-nucleotide amidase
VVARVLQRQLVLDDQILNSIRKRFKSRGVEMPANNARQALILTGSDISREFKWHRAGLWIHTDRNDVLLLPGPPSELEPMFERTCVPRLQKMSGTSALARPRVSNDGVGGVRARRQNRADLSEI